MNTKKNKKKSILSTVEIKNKNSGLLVGKADKIVSSSGVAIDTTDEAFAGGIIIQLEYR